MLSPYKGARCVFVILLLSPFSVVITTAMQAQSDGRFCCRDMLQMCVFVDRDSHRSCPSRFRSGGHHVSFGIFCPIPSLRHNLGVALGALAEFGVGEALSLAALLPPACG